MHSSWSHTSSSSPSSGAAAQGCLLGLQLSLRIFHPVVFHCLECLVQSQVVLLKHLVEVWILPRLVLLDWYRLVFRLVD